MVPCLHLVSDKMNLVLGFVGISMLCVVHPRREAFRNVGTQLEQSCELPAFHPAFIPSLKNEAWVSPQKHLGSEGGFQQGVNRVWALDFDAWPLQRPTWASETVETLGACSGCKHHGMCELEAICQSCQQVMRRRKQNHVDKMSHLIQIHNVKLCCMCHGLCKSSIFNIYCTYDKSKIFQPILSNMYMYVYIYIDR